jgi:hypothetical protein
MSSVSCADDFERDRMFAWLFFRELHDQRGFVLGELHLASAEQFDALNFFHAMPRVGSQRGK